MQPKILVVAEDTAAALAGVTVLDKVLTTGSGRQAQLAEALVLNPDAHPSERVPYFRPSLLAKSLNPGLRYGRMRERGTDAQVRFAALLANQHDAQIVLFVIDLDRRQARARDVEEASAEESTDNLVVCEGLANPEAESWYICATSSAARAEIAAELSFDPAKQASRTNSTTNGERDCKRIFGRLFPDLDAAVGVLREAELSALRDIGEEAGLTRYIEILEVRAVPLWKQGSLS